MSDMVRKVFEARRNAQEELKALYNEAEGRALSAEETEKESRIAATISDLQKREQNLLAMDEAADAERQARLDANVPPAGEKRENNAETERRAAMLRVLRGESRGADLTFEQRDLVEGTATAGGHLVQETLVGQLWEAMRESSPILNTGVTTLRTGGGETIVLPRVTGYSTASLVGEAAPIPESDPTFDRVSLGAWKFGFMVQVSSELIQDSVFDILGFVVRQGGDALGRGVDAEFVAGSGTNRPQGIVNVANTSTISAGTPTPDSLLSTFYDIAPRYRVGAEWLLSDSAVQAFRKMKDADGNYIWAPGLTAGAPDTLFGRPVQVDPFLGALVAPATGVAGNTVGIFGDLRGFYTRFAGGFRIERSDDFAFANDLVSYRFLVRCDSGIVDDTGITRMVAAA